MKHAIAITALLLLSAAVMAQPAAKKTASKKPAAAAAAPAKTQTSIPAVRDTPFPDVPKDHWAYQSVETLRKAGILHGYPPAAK